MRLFLVRHAEAAAGDPDELRPLTPGGRGTAREIGARLAAEQPQAVLSSPLLRARETAVAIAEAAGLDAEADERLAGEHIDVILTSPLLRARETAEAIARSSPAPVEVDDRLAPGATAATTREAVEGRGDTIVIVGHQPDCSEIVLELTGREQRFAPASLAEVEL